MSLMSPEMIHITEAFKILDLTGVYGKHSMHKRTLENLGLRCVPGPKFGRGHLWFCYKEEALSLKAKMDEEAQAKALAKAARDEANEPVMKTKEDERIGRIQAYVVSTEALVLTLSRKQDALDKKMDRMLELWDAVPERGQSAITFATTTANTDPF